MATVRTNPTTTTQKVTRPNLVIGGRVTDAHGAPAAMDLQLTVALEAVVADDAHPVVYEVYGVELRGRLRRPVRGLIRPLRRGARVARGLGEVHRSTPTAGARCTDPHEGGALDAADERPVDRRSSVLLADVTFARDSLNKK